MIIYITVNSWNFDSFSTCSILKICYCSKLNNFRNLMFFEIAKLGKFKKFYELQIFGIFQIGKPRNFEIFAIWRIKVWLQKFAILELFIHSIFYTTPNFANSHICPLILINFHALSPQLLFHILVEIS